MSNNLWQRLGAASGIVYVLVLLGADLIQGGPNEEETTMTAAEAIAHSCAITTAAQPTDAVIPILHTLGYLIFLFFLGSLWSALRRAEGGDGWLSAAGFGGGWRHSPSSLPAVHLWLRLIPTPVRGSTLNSGRYCKT